jgi:hypothetical protein
MMKLYERGTLTKGKSFELYIDGTITGRDLNLLIKRLILNKEALDDISGNLILKAKSKQQEG